MKISEEAMEFIINRERASAYEQGRRTMQQSCDALLAENNKMKSELLAWEEKKATLHQIIEDSVKAELQRKNFPVVRDEQKRIVKGITEFMNSPNDRPSMTFTAADLIQALCLGDVR